MIALEPDRVDTGTTTLQHPEVNSLNKPLQGGSWKLLKGKLSRMMYYSGHCRWQSIQEASAGPGRPLGLKAHGHGPLLSPYI